MGELFPDLVRTDTAPALRVDSHYSFLGRSASQAAGSIRVLMDEWFTHVPSGTPRLTERRATLRARLTSTNNSTFLGAFWELYLHEALRRCGYRLELEPDLPETKRHPDFLVTSANDSFYLEATWVESIEPEGAERRRLDPLVDYLDERPHPNFFIDLQVLRVGDGAPPRRKFRERILAWLDQLSPDSPNSDALRWQAGGWEFAVGSIGKRPEGRGNPRHRLVGMGPRYAGAISAALDLSGPIRAAAQKKARQFGLLDRPYMIAIAVETFFPVYDAVLDALLGRPVVHFGMRSGRRFSDSYRQRNGSLMTGQGAVNKRVGGFLIGWNAYPWYIGFMEPFVLRNPWTPSARRLTAELPWTDLPIDPTTGSVGDGKPGIPARRLLALADDWPGAL